MNKTYILTFCISLLTFFVVAVIALLLLIPQQGKVLNGTTTKYDGITKSEYTFEKTKDISKDALVNVHEITADDLNTFKENNQYRAEKDNPFSENTGLKSDGTYADEEGNGSTSSGSSQAQQDAIDKTTNSNGGVANPPATTK